LQFTISSKIGRRKKFVKLETLKIVRKYTM